MTDTMLLDFKIKNSGLTKGWISDRLGLSRTGFNNKVNGKTEFYASEILTLSEILKLNKEEKEKIFFNKKVDK